MWSKCYWSLHTMPRNRISVWDNEMCFLAEVGGRSRIQFTHNRYFPLNKYNQWLVFVYLSVCWCLSTCCFLSTCLFLSVFLCCLSVCPSICLWHHSGVMICYLTNPMPEKKQDVAIYHYLQRKPSTVNSTIVTNNPLIPWVFLKLDGIVSHFHFTYFIYSFSVPY